MDALKDAGITEELAEEYRAAFDMFDSDQSSRITTTNLGYVLNHQFNQNYGPDDLEYMIKQFSDDGDVDFIEFAKSIHSKLADPKYNEAFGDAFDLFDSQKAGKLSKEDLIQGMAKLGETLTNEEAEEMLKSASTKDDFVKLMSSQAGVVAAAVGGGAPAAPAMGAPRPGMPAIPRGPGAGPPRPPGAGGVPRPPGAGGVPRPPGAGGVPRPPGAGGVPRPPGAGGVPRPPGAGGVPRPPGM